jgi:hypothetical protein
MISSPRLAWDKDGSVLFYNATPQAEALREAFNNEATGNTAVASYNGYYAVVFPRLMNIYGIHFYHYAPVYILSFATSVDAAAANSGTWVSRTAPTLNNPDWYGSINAVTWEGIKAVRFQLGDNDQINSWHLYGEPAADPTDSLILRKTASDTPLDDDYWHLGIIGRGSVLYREFRTLW